MKKKINYKKYQNKKNVLRQIKFKIKIAEKINKTIAMFKEDNYSLKINNSILINIALKYYFDYLDSLDECEVLELLKNSVIDYNRRDYFE